MTRIEALPWHDERDDGHEHEERAAQNPVSEAPVIVADQILGERDEDDRADAGGREGNADRGGEPLSIPARDERRARHHPGQADADADHAADEEIELPQVRKAGSEKECRAHAREPARVHPARTETVEDEADERRGEAVHQQVNRIDAGELRARPTVVPLERQHEDHVGIAQAAPEHVEGEAGGENRDCSVADQIFSAGSRPNTWRR